MYVRYDFRRRWDYPELGILVMERPTLSKILYLQQIGRGTTENEYKNVIVIDVVDEYGAMIKACNYAYDICQSILYCHLEIL